MQDSQWLRDNNSGVRQNRLPHYWIIFGTRQCQKSPFYSIFGVDAKYANHLRVFGEMCVVADTDNKVGRTKIDPKGKISLFAVYSTQYAGDVYRLLNPNDTFLLKTYVMFLCY